MKLGDTIYISPDLTKLSDWVEGIVINVENNPFIGVTLAAKTPDNNIYFGREDLFRSENKK